MTTTTTTHDNNDAIMPSTATALKTTSRLYKWFLLVVALVFISAVRYYQSSIHQVVTNDEITKPKTRRPKHVKKQKDIPRPTLKKKKQRIHDKVHEPKSEIQIKKKEDAKKSHKRSHDDDKPAHKEEKTSKTNKHDGDAIIPSKNTTKHQSETSVSKETDKKKHSHGSSKHHHDRKPDKASSNNTDKTNSPTIKPTKQPTRQPTRERIKQDSKSETTQVDKKKKKKNESVSATSPAEISNTTTTIESTSSNATLHNNNNNINKSLIPPYDKIKGSSFTNDSCILTNTEWFPSSSSNKWQLQAPRFMIIGARDSGTRMLASHLVQQQSSILSNGHANQQVAYFSQPSYLRNMPLQRIHVGRARLQMYAKNYPTKLLQQNSSLITMDATPDYLFYSHFVATSILCVCPWIPMLVVLRNPAHVVYASFRRACSTLGWKGTFDDYVRLDMETMERAGLIGLDTTTKDKEDAWKSYLSQTKDGPVGRGFYALQLQEWFRVLKQMGRDVNQAIKVIQYEEYKARPDLEFPKVVEFLGLHMENGMKNTTTTTTASSSLAGMTEEENKTMTRLRKFFRPYNKQLYKLLGDEWDGCWDDAEEQ